MTSKRIVSICIVFCIMATLAVAMIGCEDLGAFENVTEYCNSFGDIVLISGTSREQKPYSVETYFYNDASREEFLEGEERVAYSDYVYMAIPFKNSVKMDTLALYLQSQTDVTVYISVFVSDDIPSAWKAIADNVVPQAGNGGASNAQAGGETSNTEKVYDDPELKTSIGDIAVHLESGKWNSFVLDVFEINGESQESIQIDEDQHLLLLIRNNSGVRDYDDETKSFVDPITGFALPKAEITMTNLLVRALEVESGSEAQGGN